MFTIAHGFKPWATWVLNAFGFKPNINYKNFSVVIHVLIFFI